MSQTPDLLASARRFAVEIAPRAADIEAAGRIPPEISRAMGAAGFYRMYVAERFGGLAVTPRLASEVVETIALGDAACAWVTFIAATTTLAFGRLSDAAVATIMARPDTLVTGVYAANGRAERVPGGFRVTGRWDWGSGSPNADWIGGGCAIYEDGQPLTNSAGTPRNHMLFFRQDQVTSLDTWDAFGLKGTGSTAYEVRDAFVEEPFAAGVQVKVVRDEPIYRYPAFSSLAQGIGAVALGIARGAVDEAARVVKEKRRGGSSAPLAERPQVQLEMARAEARLRSARAFFYETIDAAWSVAQAPDPVPLSYSRDMRLAVAHAMNEAVAVVDAMYTLAGGTSVYAASSLQRRLRDVHVASQHFMVSPNVMETAGRLYLDLPTNTAGF